MHHRQEQGGPANFLSQGITEARRVVPTYLARRWAGARVRAAMTAALPIKTNGPPNVCQRLVLRTNPKGSKTECVFADGNALLVSTFLASFICAGNELLFHWYLQPPYAGTQ